MSELIGNASARRSALEEMTRSLAAGPLDPVAAAEAKTWIDAVTPQDVVAVVDALVAEALPLERLKPAVSRLLNLVSRPLARVAFETEDPFFASLVRENRRIAGLLDEFRRPLSALNAAKGSSETRTGADAALAVIRASLARALDPVSGIAIHYVKKENVLFPYFEARHPRYRCLSVMWSIHDDVRASLRDLEGLAAPEGPPDEARLAELNAAFGRLFFDVHALILREERLLFPVAAPLLTAAEKRSLFDECRALGWSLLEAEDIAALESLAAAKDAAEAGRTTATPGGTVGAINLDSGSLAPTALDALLRLLPLDLTFVDAEDKVAYFSNGPERVFPRSPAIIGRDVRNCHPAASVDRVMRIVAAFKVGERDREDFWLELRGRFVRIQYFAVRGPSGEYLGTLEASQDLTEARALTGEKRLAGS